MNNEKILNLTDVDAEDFEAIKEAIEDWKKCGLSGKFTFISEQDVQDSAEILKQTYQRVYNKGAWHGGFALFGGIVLGTMIYSTFEHFMTKK